MARKPRPDRAEHQEADTWQYKRVAFLGFKVDHLSKAQAFGIVKRLEDGYTRAEVARQMGWKQWFAEPPAWYQVRDLKALGIDPAKADSPYEARLLIEAGEMPELLHRKLLRRIDKADSHRLLDAVRRDLVLVRGVLPEKFFDYVAEAGKQKRTEMPADDAIED